MDCISHDDIQELNWIKSARVGATKLMLAGVAFFASHKQRNQLFYQPTNPDASEFVKTELNPMIRDVPEVQRVFPHYQKRGPKNSDTMKMFSGVKLLIKGGKTAGNYRRVSTDIVYYDELEAFDKNVEKEGDPLTLGDKRTEGSFFPKSIRMTTPKTKNDSLIERAVEQSKRLYQYHVPCPECEKLQVIEWGGPGADFGIKFFDHDPETAVYECKHCHHHIENHQLTWMNDRGVWVDEFGRWIDTNSLYKCEDGEVIFLDDGELLFRTEEDKPEKPPRRISFHIWSAYSPFTAWSEIVKTFLDANETKRREGDTSALQTFVNTFLGETWSEEEGERPDWEALHKRREAYPAGNGRIKVPKRAVFLTGFIDVQDDRFEMGVYGWAEHSENWLIDYQVLVGNLSQQPIWDILFQFCNKTYQSETGQTHSVRWGIDTGGHYTKEVYEFVKRFAPGTMYPTKGSSDLTHPLYEYPRSLNKHGSRLIMVGTKQAKDTVYNSLAINSDDLTQPTPGYWHAPIADFASKTYFQQLTAEEKIMVRHKGRWMFNYDDKGRRNEALDIAVGSLVILRVHESHHGIDLARLASNTSHHKLTMDDIAKGLGKR